jgi:fructokinase
MLGAQTIAIPAPRVDVVDTVGAGDSFMSALLAAMNRDGALGVTAAAPARASLERWLRFAACASAITCTRKGSNPPTLAEVERALVS